VLHRDMISASGTTSISSNVYVVTQAYESSNLLGSVFQLFLEPNMRVLS